MSDRIVTLRHRQICDLCHHPIEAGDKAHLVRDDFWPANCWFEHCVCPSGAAVPRPPKPVTLPFASQVSLPQPTP
jgi:hypothetical protein